jgi:signal transduction histidine kinase
MLYLRKFYHRLNRLNQRLMLLFIIVTLVPLVLLGIANAIATPRLINAEVSSRQNEVMQLVAEKVEHLVGDVELHLREAGLTWFRLNLSSEDMGIFLETLALDIPAYATMWITDSTGQEVVRLEGGRAVDAEFLRNRSEEETFFLPARGERYFSTVRLVDNEPRLTIALPLLVNDELVGTVAGQMSLTQSWNVIRSVVIGTDGYAVLVDRRGNLIVHRDEQVMARRLNLATIPSVSAVAAGQNQAWTTMYQSPIGGDVLGSAMLIDGPGWILILERSIDDAFGAVRESNLRLVLAMILALAAAMMMSIFFSRQITGPVIRLRNAANRVRQGELSLYIPDHNPTEIGELARAFNSMTASLKDRIQEINEKNQALMAATLKAEEASRLKDEFLAVMSHELRTPLHAIIGYTGIILMDDNLDNQEIEMLERVESNSQRLLALINDLLDISRLEAGKMRLFPTEIIIRSLAQQWCDQMQVLATDKGLAFNLKIDDRVPEALVCDENALTKIVTNLLSNAIKFTGEGQVDLAITRDQDWLKFVIQDTGIGIPAAMHEIIFDRFRQVDSSNTRPYGGTGLGLAIVRSMCEAMQGSITLESIPEQGSTFTVLLPLRLKTSGGQDVAPHG